MMINANTVSNYSGLMLRMSAFQQNSKLSTTILTGRGHDFFNDATFLLSPLAWPITIHKCRSASTSFSHSRRTFIFSPCYYNLGDFCVRIFLSGSLDGFQNSSISVRVTGFYDVSIVIHNSQCLRHCLGLLYFLNSSCVSRGNHFTALKISCMFRDDISQLFCCQLIPISLNSNGLLDNLSRHGGLTDGFCSCGFSTSHHDSTSDNRATVLGSLVSSWISVLRSSE
mmetsp:Transcript_59202/g.96610  ORF Transcript_59202/g.96610 Transcript_59202/m.96610 type:complete len:226 (-) Transcript_59202:375-1052(-)